MKRKQWLFSAGLVILLILVSFIVRFRFEDKQMDEYIKKASILPSVYSDQFDPDLSTTAYEIFDNSLDTYDELEENADTVVVGEVMDQCQNHGTVKTLIQIRQVIKGNLTESESIEVYEPVNFTEDPRDFPDGRLEGSSGYLLMKKGQLYILFLQSHPYSETYNLVSDLYGKLPVENSPKVYHLEYTGEYIPLSKFDGYDAFYVDPKEEKEYLKEEMQLYEDRNCEEYVRLKKKEDAIILYEQYESKLEELWQECQRIMRQ